MIQAELPGDVLIERKRSSKNGVLLGFSVDWTEGPKLTESEITRVRLMLEGEGLHVVYSPWQNYLDAFAAKPDKGVALSTLAAHLGVSPRDVAYLGDSEADNDAFDMVGMSFGVDHGQPVKVLRCNYLLNFENLDTFLKSLPEDDFTKG